MPALSTDTCGRKCPPFSWRRLPRRLGRGERIGTWRNMCSAGGWHWNSATPTSGPYRPELTTGRAGVSEETILEVVTASAPFVAIAVVGGAIRQLYSRRVSLRSFVVGVVGSGFTGWVSYGALTYFDLPQSVVGSVVGLMGWAGPDALIFVLDIAKKMLQMRAGTPDDSLPWSGVERRHESQNYDGPDRRAR